MKDAKSKAIENKRSVLKGYADRMRMTGHGEEYNNRRSKMRKFHNSPEFKRFKKETKGSKFIPISR